MPKFKVTLYAETRNVIKIEAESAQEADHLAWEKFFEIFPYCDGKSWNEDSEVEEIKENNV